MKIAHLLSGGVDSSVALHLLRRQSGHQVVAFYLKIWLEEELQGLGECPWEDDLRYAHAVCDAAGVTLEVVPLQREYHRRVVSWAVDELRAGRTPSPDLFCNRRIKFGAFLEHLGDAGFERVGSGHYARLERRAGRLELRRAADPVKDQTYFLSQLDPAQLERCLFPLGRYPKSEVRALARRLDLPNQDRRDSQGICFLGKIPYDDFVRAYLGERRGEIRDLAGGGRLGEHRGYWFHTIGQRKGLGLGGGPWYVVHKDVDDNVIWVAHGSRLAEHRRRRFRLDQPRWLCEPPDGARLGVKIRHSPAVAACRLTRLPDGELEIELEEPDAGLADGQSAVLYDGDLCLCGGQIRTAVPSLTGAGRHP